MTGLKRLFGGTAVVVLLVAVITLTVQAQTSPSVSYREKVIHELGANSNDGSNAAAGLISDKQGNLYGTTEYGGANGSNCSGVSCGTVFELMKEGHGKWREKVLYTFSPTGGDGFGPTAGLVFDKAGNLYGTTMFGGANNCLGSGCGAVFKLTRGSNGKWTEKVLHSFNYDGVDGFYPESRLVFDKSGNLYGGTFNGGLQNYCTGYGCGVIFELTPGHDGQWTEKVIYTFGTQQGDGSTVVNGLVFDKAGNMYGVTIWGGTGTGQCTLGCGTVFELKPTGNGDWTESVLHDFSNNGTDGIYPDSDLLLDAKGNLYGTTSDGGSSGTGCNAGDGCGTVFELTPGNGHWTETILHNFMDDGKDGVAPDPTSGLIFDKAGNLYGTTKWGGTNSACALNCGTIFELMPGSDGWTEKILDNLDGKDGYQPDAGLILDKAGNLYGTTFFGGTGTGCGGSYGCGTVFELTH